MSGVNKVILIGNLGKDPESKVLDSGDMVVNFSIATNESWKNKEGVKVDKTTWHNCVAWRKTAEIIEKYCKKGDKIYVEGKIENREYEKDGIKRYATDIVINHLTMLGSKSDSAPTATATEAPAPEAAAPAAPAPAKKKDDLPF